MINSSFLTSTFEENSFLNAHTYWQNKLAAPQAALLLPLDFKRPLHSNMSSRNTHQLVISRLQSEKIAAFSESSLCSITDILLCIFKISLSRWCGESDLIISTPFASKGKIIVIRSFIDSGLSFHENLNLISVSSSEAFANASSFEEDLLESSSKVLFSCKRIENKEIAADLGLLVNYRSEKIILNFNYRPDLFRNLSIERFAQCFIHTFNHALACPDTPLDMLSPAPEEHLKIILEKWNDTKMSFDNRAFYKIFEQYAHDDPEACALENKSGTMSYAELNNRANLLAMNLKKLGVGRGDLVGISLNRDFDMVAALLGILKSAAGYVPLDPAFPKERLNYMIENSTPKIIITQKELSEGLICEKKVYLRDLFKKSSVKVESMNVEQNLSDTAYIIYTSGSTGRPKGVELTHECVSNFLFSMKNTFKIERKEKILAVTTLSFDIAVLELFLPLISGACLYLATKSESMDGSSLKKIIDDKKITLMQATPLTWKLLLAAGWKGNSGIKVLCGGEAFPIDLAKNLLLICGEVWNMYGPTETTVWSTCKKLTSHDEFITVGTPIANTSVYILDKKLNMLPIGSPGELFIGGAGVARGYFKRPDLTSEKFQDDPFITGQRMYATGDLARFHTDGEIECLGRSDGQVKVRGYRIELGEIEVILRSLPEIEESVVITREMENKDKVENYKDNRIVAFIKVKNSYSFNERFVKAELRKVLPAYMIPSHFVEMSEIPKTLNGKIDKKSLPEVQTFQILEEHSSGSNKDEIEKTLFKMWKSVLGQSYIRKDDNFFDIGGDSLMAVQLFSKISLEFSIDLPLSALIEASDFKALVEMIRARINGTELAFKQSKTIVEIKKTGTESPLFCFHAVGGNVLNYVNLLSATGKNRPVLAFQSLGLDGVSRPLTTIEDMAATYIKEMRMVQPQGPYLLAGGSMGGTIAFEVACQLRKENAEVEKLVMFDTFGPTQKETSAKNSFNFFESAKATLSYKIRVMVKKIQHSYYSLISQKPPLAVILFNIERSNYQAIWKYKPVEIYKGDIHLIRSNKKDDIYSDPEMGWSGLIDGTIHTYEINAHHNSFVESPELITIFSGLIKK